MASSTPPARPVVLLLQDEPLPRMVLADFIEEAGCDTLETHSTVEAIRLLETRSDIRLVMADLDVRGSVMGLKLAALIRERWPPVELLLTGTFLPESSEIPMRGEFFYKPIDLRSVIATVRRLTGQ